MHGKAIRLMVTTLADWLQQEINQSNLSIREFARKSGLGQATLSAILAGAGYPSVATLIQLAEYTKTDICSLMTLIAPQVSHLDADSSLLLARIKRLPPDKQAIVDTYLIGLLLQNSNQSPET